MGFTTTVAGTSLGSMLSIDSAANSGEIRSVTIINQTSATTAVVYGNRLGSGTALFAASPGQILTVPIQAASGLSVRFVVLKGQAFDGAVYIHTDLLPLSASGSYVQGSLPLWVWDSSVWDGGAVWSG